MRTRTALASLALLVCAAVAQAQYGPKDDPVIINGTLTKKDGDQIIVKYLKAPEMGFKLTLDRKCVIMVDGKTTDLKGLKVGTRVIVCGSQANLNATQIFAYVDDPIPDGPSDKKAPLKLKDK